MNNQTVTIDLDTPIKRGETEINQLVLRRPQAGELRGLHMSQVLAMSTDALFTLIPRIASPALIPQELNHLDPGDLIQIGYAILGLIAPKSMQQGLPQ
jgi:hypothetical protein